MERSGKGRAPPRLSPHRLACGSAPTWRFPVAAPQTAIKVGEFEVKQTAPDTRAQASTATGIRNRSDPAGMCWFAVFTGLASGVARAPRPGARGAGSRRGPAPAPGAIEPCSPAAETRPPYRRSTHSPRRGSGHSTQPSRSRRSRWPAPRVRNRSSRSSQWWWSAQPCG